MSFQGLEIDGCFLSTLLFADDQFVINGNHNGKYTILELRNYYRKWGMEISLGKSEYLVVEAGGQDLNLEDSYIKIFTKFIFLSLIFNKLPILDVASRINQGRRDI